MKKIQMILALACMTSLMACQQESSTTSTTGSSAVQGDVAPQISTEVKPEVKEEVVEELVEEDSILDELETSKVSTSLDSYTKESSEEEYEELIHYFTDISVALEIFEEALNEVSASAVDVLLNPQNVAILETYCQQMVDVGESLSEIENIIPPVDFQLLHDAFAEDCETLAESYYQMVDFVQNGSSDENIQLQVDMAEVFVAMQDSLAALGEQVIAKLNQ